MLLVVDEKLVDFVSRSSWIWTRKAGLALTKAMFVNLIVMV